jgi:hypothetical protein
MNRDKQLCEYSFLLVARGKGFGFPKSEQESRGPRNSVDTEGLSFRSHVTMTTDRNQNPLSARMRIEIYHPFSDGEDCENCRIE